MTSQKSSRNHADEVLLKSANAIKDQHQPKTNKHGSKNIKILQLSQQKIVGELIKPPFSSTVTRLDLNEHYYRIIYSEKQKHKNFCEQN